MLTKIRDYIKQQKTCNLADLSMQFNTTPEAMRGMLSHWLRKGQLVCVSPPCLQGCQKGCVSCDPAELEIYQWEQTKCMKIPTTSIS